MKKDEFMEFVSTHNRKDLDNFLHEKTKPVKIIYPVVRVRKGKGER